ncbi:MAG: transketolase, partial [Actinomycetota bacterium]
REGWHGKALSADEAEKAIAELGGARDVRISPRKPDAGVSPPANGAQVTLPTYADGIATRKAFGEALAALAVRPDVVAVDAEVSNSTHTDEVLEVAPERFVESYIAEQNMIGVAVGLQVLGKKAFAVTFGAFHTRAFDFIRMAAVSRANLRLAGSHAGVSIGEDGPSQMALEDLAMMRAVHGSTVLYPADGNSTAKLVVAMADLPGISYLRTTREKTPKLYDADVEFQVGGSVVVRSSADDRVTLVGAGVTVFESMKAADALANDGISARVIDAYSIKPIDAGTLHTALAETGLVVTVEDHWPEGGLGEAVLGALASEGEIAGRVHVIAVRDMPGSGKPEEMREWAGISAPKIAETVRSLLG